MIRTNPDEAVRPRAEARPFNDKAKSVRKAHNERIHPALDATEKEYAAMRVTWNVNVNVLISDLDLRADAKEPVQIPRAAAAFHDNPKEMVLALGHATSAKASGGISAKPRTIRVTLTGDREPAPRIAQLFAASGVGSIAKK